MENYALSIITSWIHLIATVAWIGGMFTNFFVYLPALGKTLDLPATGKLMAVVMKRFRIIVYVAIFLFLITGMISGYLIGTSEGKEADTLWRVLFFSKIAVFVLMVILAVYAFEIMAPKVSKIAACECSEITEEARFLGLCAGNSYTGHHSSFITLLGSSCFEFRVKHELWNC
jgi:uncharacterized membrane protein